MGKERNSVYSLEYNFFFFFILSNLFSGSESANCAETIGAGILVNLFSF